MGEQSKDIAEERWHVMLQGPSGYPIVVRKDNGYHVAKAANEYQRHLLPLIAQATRMLWELEDIARRLDAGGADLDRIIRRCRRISLDARGGDLEGAKAAAARGKEQ